MAFIKLTLSNSLDKEAEKDFIINTDFIINIIDTGAEPIMYWTSNGFEKETTVSIVNYCSFKELMKLLDCKFVCKQNEEFDING